MENKSMHIKEYLERWADPDLREGEMWQLLSNPFYQLLSVVASMNDESCQSLANRLLKYWKEAQ